MSEMEHPKVCTYCGKPIGDKVYKINVNLISAFCSERCRSSYYFLKGHCLEFAIALHRTYGYPMRAIFSRDAIRSLNHAFCVSPKDENITIDGRGVSSINEVMRDFPGYNVEEVTEDNLKVEFYRDAKLAGMDYETMINKAIDCLRHTREANIGIIYEIKR